MAPKRQKTVLITGCSKGGIGDALAQEFHKRGARVFATARNLSKVEHLKEMGLTVLPLDVVDQASISAAVEAVEGLTRGEEGGVASLDILVNNSGGGYQVPLLDADIETAKKMFDVNVWGVLAVTKAFAPLLKNSKGRIVNIGSVVSKMPVPWQGLYNASKAALGMLNDTLELEVAPLGITVIHIVTGGIATEFFNHSSGKPDVPQDSLYQPIAKDLENSLAGKEARATQTCTPQQYAVSVVKNALSSSPSSTQWVGGSSLEAWAGDTFLPLPLKKYIIHSRWGLGKLATKFKKSIEKTVPEQKA